MARRKKAAASFSHTSQAENRASAGLFWLGTPWKCPGWTHGTAPCTTGKAPTVVFFFVCFFWGEPSQRTKQTNHCGGLNCACRWPPTQHQIPTSDTGCFTWAAPSGTRGYREEKSQCCRRERAGSCKLWSQSCSFSCFTLSRQQASHRHVARPKASPSPTFFSAAAATESAGARRQKEGLIPNEITLPSTRLDRSGMKCSDG